MTEAKYQWNFVCDDIDEVSVKDYSNEILKQLKNDHHLCDAELIAGKNAKIIPVHSNVLAAASKYFSRIFLDSIADRKRIVLADLDETAVEMLVEFCYSGATRVTADNVENLLMAAKDLSISAVTYACSDYLMHHLKPSNSLRVVNLAVQFGLMDLLKISLEYCKNNFTNVSKTTLFLELSISQLAELLKCDDLSVPSEKHVFFAMIKWIEHSAEERKKFVPELLKFIRLHHLETKVRCLGCFSCSDQQIGQ